MLVHSTGCTRRTEGAIGFDAQLELRVPIYTTVEKYSQSSMQIILELQFGNLIAIRKRAHKWGAQIMRSIHRPVERERRRN